MSPALRLALSVTDIAFLLYWAIAAAHAAGWAPISAEWLYPNADDPRVVAWNWSFLPLDIAFSITGLAAVRAARAGKPIWRPLALISLILTMTAGGMAVSYWLIMNEIVWSWFLANLILVLFPIPFLPGLLRAMA